MEIKLTSDMFEQGNADPDRSIGSDYGTQMKLPSSHSNNDRRIRTKELIPCGSERKINFLGDFTNLKIWVFEFDKDKKYLGHSTIGWFYFQTSSYDLLLGTAYVAFVIGKRSSDGLLDPSVMDTLSLIPYHDDWISIGVDRYRGQCSTWATKPYVDWGIKAGDVVTFQIRIKSTSGKKLRARIEWFNSGNDRVSTYPEGVQVIENGEGISTITQTVPSGYSQMGLWLDANLTVSTHTATTQELVKADIFVISSSVPSNLGRGGVLIMNDYPILSIITNREGLEYARGYNILSISKAYLEEIGRSGAVTVSKVVSECGIDVTVNSDTSGVAVPRFQYLDLPYALTPYRLTYEAWAELPSGSPKIRCNNDVCDANPRGIEITATRTKFTSTHYPAKTYIESSYRGFVDFEIRAVTGSMKAGTKIHIRNIILTLGQDEFAFRPNPADLVGGGVPMSIIARGLPLTVRNSIDEAIQNSAAQLEQRLSTAITQTGESIKNEVAQQYYAKGDTDRIIAEASTILEQKYNSFEMSFNSFKQMVGSNQNLTNAEFATITKFIRFIDGNIFLGEEGNNQMLKIAKDRISFLQGNQEVAYISDSTLYIYDGVFLNSLRIGNFAFVPRANGSLDFKKVR